MRRISSALALVLSGSLVYSQQPKAPAPVSPATSPQVSPSTPQAPHTLLDGTPIKLRLSQSISSAEAKVGQEVPFEVIEEVKVDDAIVLPKGATAIANVTEAEHKKSMGRAGKLNVAISYARLADSEKVALRAVKEAKGGGHVGAMTGAIVATSIVFFPAAPLFLFIHGKDITIPQGTEITAFVDGDMHLDMARFGAAPAAPGPTVPSVAQAILAIASTPAGADIELDGNFVGNTPSSVNLTSGSHQVVVKKKGFVDWTKTLNVTGGTVNLTAELEQAPGQ
ncbi:PEGA domain-containing protein [Occallatibacter savannae]|uniref:PEGA domain-containing protein n=1 Tax=Occallatibacter savannae TaxID=1002691 RepID=UPI000D6911F4|nr:PEGA domain-containing protein [Occallatibacter savannae]